MNTATLQRSDNHSATRKMSHRPRTAKAVTDAAKSRQHKPRAGSAKAAQPSKRPTKNPRPVQRPVSPQQTPDIQPDQGPQITLAHAFVMLGYVVGAVLFLMFGLDLLIGIPFRRLSILFDVTNVIVGLMLVYLSWNTHQELG